MSWRLAMLWLMAIFWPVAFGLPGISAQGRVTAVIGALLLSLAAVTSCARCLAHAPHTYRDLVGALASLACLCLSVGLCVWAEGARDNVAELLVDRPHFSPGQLDRAHDLPNPTSGGLMARVLYHELGLRIGYRDAGQLTVFEPSPKDSERRLQHMELQREAVKVKQRLRHQQDIARLAVYTQLLAFPVLSAIYLLRFKRRGRELPARQPSELDDT